MNLFNFDEVFALKETKMNILNLVILSVAFCTIPAGVLWLCRKISLLGKIGPVLLLYIIGLIIGNIGLMPAELQSVQEVFSNATIPLAIPLMLYGCTFHMKGTGMQLMALVTGLISVIAAVIAGYLIFGTHLQDGWKIGGMLTGVYTGGTINLAALKTMLNVEETTYLLINSYDIMISFLYLSFLLTFGIRLFRRILPHDKGRISSKGEKVISEEHIKAEENPYKGLFTKNGLKQTGILTGVTVLICAISGGFALLLSPGVFMTAFILLLTTLGIGASFIKRIHDMKYSYDIGMYFIYIFCIAVASMADLGELDLNGGFYLLGYLMTAVFGSLLIQTIFAKIFRIDADLMVISSVTYINSPPFVPMIAAAMKNRSVLIPGLSIGIIGYAVGNYLGFIISGLLKIL